MAREIFATDEIVVRESQGVATGGRTSANRTLWAPHLVLTPAKDTYGRLTRAEALVLYEVLGRWLGVRA